MRTISGLRSEISKARLGTMGAMGLMLVALSGCALVGKNAKPVTGFERALFTVETNWVPLSAEAVEQLAELDEVGALADMSVSTQLRGAALQALRPKFILMLPTKRVRGLGQPSLTFDSSRLCFS